MANLMRFRRVTPSRLISMLYSAIVHERTPSANPRDWRNACNCNSLVTVSDCITLPGCPFLGRCCADRVLVTLKWSGRPDSNRRHRPWQGRTLPAELLPLNGKPYFYPETIRMSNVMDSFNNPQHL